MLVLFLDTIIQFLFTAANAKSTIWFWELSPGGHSCLQHEYMQDHRNAKRKKKQKQKDSVLRMDANPNSPNQG